MRNPTTAHTASTDTRATNSKFSIQTLIWAVAVLFLLAAIALPRLPLPLEVDQSLFFYGASAMLDGARYYVDFWDWKAPGIYWFFMSAITLFGASEVAIHSFEFIWLAVLAITLIYSLRHRFVQPQLAFVVPLFAVGVYLLRPIPWYTTQVEYIIGLPLFICMALLCIDYRTERAQILGFFAAGVAAGCATLFKPLYAPLPVAFWLTRVCQLANTHGFKPVTILTQQGLPFAAGVVVVWGLVAGWFVHLGTFNAFYESVFLAPLEAFGGDAERPYGRIFSMLYFAALAFGLLIPWVVIATRAAFKNLSRTDAMCLLAIVWIVVGYPVVMSQSFSWWRYHMQIFYVPMAIVAAFGIDLALPWLTQRFNTSRRKVLSLIVLISLLGHMPLWLGNVWWWKDAIASNANSTQPAVYRYQQHYDRYAIIRCDVAFLDQTDALPGPIFVFGTPQYLVLSGRKQAIPIRGTSVRTLPVRLWKTLTTQLIAAKPPYIFVSEESQALLRQRAPAISEWLSSDYRSFTHSQCTGDLGDRWYQRR